MSFYPYSYDDLLYRLHVSRTADDSYKKANLPSLKVTKKNRLSIVSNFDVYCERLNRSKEHVSNYYRTETGSNISINSQNQMVIQAIFSETKCDSIMKNYIKQYVMCKQCKGIESSIIKENGLMFLQCHRCDAKTSMGKIAYV
jgi:translation initiation factor 2 subunit 2